MDRTEAVIFDMDGTLLDSMGYWRGENRLFLARRGLDVPPELEHTIDTMSSRAFALRFVEEHGAPYTHETIVREYQLEMVSHYQSAILPKRGALAYLDALKSAGVKLCVATATPRSTARMALGIHDMLRYFEFVTDEAEMGVSKSSKDFFLAVCARLGARAGLTAVFEDSLYAMRAAYQAGMRVCAIDERVHRYDAEKQREIDAISWLRVRDFNDALNNLNILYVS